MLKVWFAIWKKYFSVKNRNYHKNQQINRTNNEIKNKDKFHDKL